MLLRILSRLLVRSARGLRGNLPKLVLACSLLAILPVLALWRGLDRATGDPGANASEMVVESLDQSGNRMNLVLKEKAGPRRLVLTVGVAEASSIVEDLKLPYQAPSVTAYGMTRAITDGVGIKIQRVIVNNVNDKSLFAKVIVATDDREVAVDAAPSDAIALAVRARAPIYADATVLEKAGVTMGR